MLAITHTRIISSIQAALVQIEVHSSTGIPAFHLVGMAETAVKESRDRVNSAITNSGFEFPWGRLVVNLSPADISKAGSGYDLAIAVGLLLVSGQVPLKQATDIEFYGELTLSGQLRGIRGLLPALLAPSSRDKIRIIPTENADDAALVDDDNILLADSLKQVIDFLTERAALTNPPKIKTQKPPPMPLNWHEVREQKAVKQSLLLAAAGGHSALMIGPPGCGKSMLAQAFQGILPNLSREQMLQTATIYSIAGLPNPHWCRPPFRSPHHTSSAVAIIGGGGKAKPGEVSLAHNGLLFLDEFLEFTRAALEGLREPLETGEVHITRAEAKAIYPAQFQLICAMNPCNCGFMGSSQCRCTPDSIARYRSKLSGPLLDRIDLHINVFPIDPEKLMDPIDPAEKSSEYWREKVFECRQRQYQRQGVLNAQLGTNAIEALAVMDEDCQAFLRQSIRTLNLSGRAFHRILRLLITLSDWQGQPINQQMIAQAIALRSLDRQ